MQEVDDVNLIVNSCIAAILNGVIFAQIMVYGPVMIFLIQGPADSVSKISVDKELEEKENKISEKIIAASPKPKKKKNKKTD